MSDADKIVAAIFTAGMCYGKEHNHAKYLETYDAFVKLMKARRKTNKQETKGQRCETRWADLVTSSNQATSPRGLISSICVSRDAMRA